MTNAIHILIIDVDADALKPMGRSALYLILSNRTYLGETTHKGASYPGEHKAIIPSELFDTVQERLAELGPALSGRPRLLQDAPFAGLVFDETGTAMLPTYAIKQPGLHYRYYVSRPALKGERSKAAISRMPAPPFEGFISGVVVRLGLPRDRPIQSVVRRVEILSNSIVVRFDRSNVLAAWRAADPTASGTRDREIIDRRRGHLATGETIRDDDGQLILTLPVRARFRGGRASVLDPASAAGSTPRPEKALVKAIARAHSWRHMLLTGEVSSIEALAKRFGHDRGHVARTLNLGFLSPALTRAIVRGEQPEGLRLTHLLATDLPLSWREQEALVAGAAGIGGL